MELFLRPVESASSAASRPAAIQRDQPSAAGFPASRHPPPLFPGGPATAGLPPDADRRGARPAPAAEHFSRSAGPRDHSSARESDQRVDKPRQTLDSPQKRVPNPREQSPVERSRPSATGSPCLQCASRRSTECKAAVRSFGESGSVPHHTTQFPSKVQSPSATADDRPADQDCDNAAHQSESRLPARLPRYTGPCCLRSARPSRSVCPALVHPRAHALSPLPHNESCCSPEYSRSPALHEQPAERPVPRDVPKLLQGDESTHRRIPAQDSLSARTTPSETPRWRHSLPAWLPAAMCRSGHPRTGRRSVNSAAPIQKTPVPSTTVAAARAPGRWFAAGN